MIEVMIVVAILGILAAIAIPVFRSYVLRSKTSEVSANLNASFKGLAHYWSDPQGATGKGMDGTNGASHCIWFVSYHPDADPGIESRLFGYRDDLKGHGDTLVWLGIDRAQFVYFSYQIRAEDRCNIKAKTPGVATFEAIGDLDGDGTNSSFELAIGSNEDNELYHSRGFYVQNELE
jgi:hypothetical protein